MPFRQIAVVLLALIAILLAALLVLSFGGDDEAGSPDGAAPAPIDTVSTSSTTTTTSTTLAPTTTTVPVACGADAEPGDAATTSTVATSTTVAPTADSVAPDSTTTEAPLVPTLGRNSSLSTVGLDEVTFGLTVVQATRAAGTVFDPCSPPDDCYRVTPRVAPTGISFVVDNGTIERVDIVGDSPITTVSGAGIGTTEARLDELFGDRLTRDDLGGGRTDVIFVPADENDRDFRVVFTTVDGVVESMRAGRMPLVLDPAPCA